MSEHSDDFRAIERIPDLLLAFPPETIVNLLHLFLEVLQLRRQASQIAELGKNAHAKTVNGPKKDLAEFWNDIARMLLQLRMMLLDQSLRARVRNSSAAAF